MDLYNSMPASPRVHLLDQSELSDVTQYKSDILSSAAWSAVIHHPAEDSEPDELPSTVDIDAIKEPATPLPAPCTPGGTNENYDVSDDPDSDSTSDDPDSDSESDTDSEEGGEEEGSRDTWSESESESATEEEEDEEGTRRRRSSSSSEAEEEEKVGARRWRSHLVGENYYRSRQPDPSNPMKVKISAMKHKSTDRKASSSPSSDEESSRDGGEVEEEEESEKERKRSAQKPSCSLENASPVRPSAIDPLQSDRDSLRSAAAAFHRSNRNSYHGSSNGVSGRNVTSRHRESPSKTRTACGFNKTEEVLSCSSGDSRTVTSGSGDSRTVTSRSSSHPSKMEESKLLNSAKCSSISDSRTVTSRSSRDSTQDMYSGKVSNSDSRTVTSRSSSHRDSPSKMEESKLLNSAKCSSISDSRTVTSRSSRDSTQDMNSGKASNSDSRTVTSRTSSHRDSPSKMEELSAKCSSNSDSRTVTSRSSSHRDSPQDRKVSNSDSRTVTSRTSSHLDFASKVEDNSDSRTVTSRSRSKYDDCGVFRNMNGGDSTRGVRRKIVREAEGERGTDGRTVTPTRKETVFSSIRLRSSRRQPAETLTSTISVAKQRNAAFGATQVTESSSNDEDGDDEEEEEEEEAEEEQKEEREKSGRELEKDEMTQLDRPASTLTISEHLQVINQEDLAAILPDVGGNEFEGKGASGGGGVGGGDGGGRRKSKGGVEGRVERSGGDSSTSSSDIETLPDVSDVINRITSDQSDHDVSKMAADDEGDDGDDDHADDDAESEVDEVGGYASKLLQRFNQQTEQLCSINADQTTRRGGTDVVEMEGGGGEEGGGGGGYCQVSPDSGIQSVNGSPAHAQTTAEPIANIAKLYTRSNELQGGERGKRGPGRPSKSSEKKKWRKERDHQLKVPPFYKKKQQFDNDLPQLYGANRRGPGRPKKSPPVLEPNLPSSSQKRNHHKHRHHHHHHHHHHRHHHQQQAESNSSSTLLLNEICEQVSKRLDIAAVEDPIKEQPPVLSAINGRLKHKSSKLHHHHHHHHHTSAGKSASLKNGERKKIVALPKSIAIRSHRHKKRKKSRKSVSMDAVKPDPRFLVDLDQLVVVFEKLCHIKPPVKPVSATTAKLCHTVKPGSATTAKLCHTVKPGSATTAKLCHTKSDVKPGSTKLPKPDVKLVSANVTKLCHTKSPKPDVKPITSDADTAKTVAPVSSKSSKSKKRNKEQSNEVAAATEVPVQQQQQQLSSAGVVATVKRRPKKAAVETPKGRSDKPEPANNEQRLPLKKRHYHMSSSSTTPHLESSSPESDVAVDTHVTPPAQHMVEKSENAGTDSIDEAIEACINKYGGASVIATPKKRHRPDSDTATTVQVKSGATSVANSSSTQPTNKRVSSSVANSSSQPTNKRVSSRSLSQSCTVTAATAKVVTATAVTAPAGKRASCRVTAPPVVTAPVTSSAATKRVSARSSSAVECGTANANATPKRSSSRVTKRGAVTRCSVDVSSESTDQPLITPIPDEAPKCGKSRAAHKPPPAGVFEPSTKIDDLVSLPKIATKIDQLVSLPKITPPPAKTSVCHVLDKLTERLKGLDKVPERQDKITERVKGGLDERSKLTERVKGVHDERSKVAERVKSGHDERSKVAERVKGQDQSCRSDSEASVFRSLRTKRANPADDGKSSQLDVKSGSDEVDVEKTKKPKLSDVNSLVSDEDKSKKRKLIRDVRVHVTKLLPSDLVVTAKPVVDVPAAKPKVKRRKAINRTGFPVKKKKKKKVVQVIREEEATLGPPQLEDQTKMVACMQFDETPALSPVSLSPKRESARQRINNKKCSNSSLNTSSTTCHDIKALVSQLKERKLKDMDVNNTDEMMTDNDSNLIKDEKSTVEEEIDVDEVITDNMIDRKPRDKDDSSANEQLKSIDVENSKDSALIDDGEVKSNKGSVVVRKRGEVVDNVVKQEANNVINNRKRRDKEESGVKIIANKDSNVINSVKKQRRDRKELEVNKDEALKTDKVMVDSVLKGKKRRDLEVDKGELKVNKDSVIKERKRRGKEDVVKEEREEEKKEEEEEDVVKVEDEEEEEKETRKEEAVVVTSRRSTRKVVTEERKEESEMKENVVGKRGEEKKVTVERKSLKDITDRKQKDKGKKEVGVAVEKEKEEEEEEEEKEESVVQKKITRKVAKDTDENKEEESGEKEGGSVEKRPRLELEKRVRHKSQRSQRLRLQDKAEVSKRRKRKRNGARRGRTKRMRSMEGRVGEKEVEREGDPLPSTASDLEEEQKVGGGLGGGGGGVGEGRKRAFVPRWRKRYLTAGLFSDVYKRGGRQDGGGGEHSHERDRDRDRDRDWRVYRPDEHRYGLMPAPIYCAKWVRQRRVHFQLPHDLWWLHKHARLPGRDVVPSWNHKKIRTNVYYDVKPSYMYEAQACNCNLPSAQGAQGGQGGKPPLGCGEDCINRLIYTECSPRLCPCKQHCSNQRIQRHEWAPGLVKFMTADKGWGVKTRHPIRTGEFILEYVGEVVSEREFKSRMASRYHSDTHHYCLHLDGGLVIDGHRMGGDGRFVNHSCEPNCEMQKWSVNGLFRMALFALRDIRPHEELTYDYNFALFNPKEGQPCLCKSSNCRGVIGGKYQRLNQVLANKESQDNTVATKPRKKSRKGQVDAKQQQQQQQNKTAVGSTAKETQASSCQVGSTGSLQPPKPLTATQQQLVASTRLFLLRNFAKVKRLREKLKQAVETTKSDESSAAGARNVRARRPVHATNSNAQQTPVADLTESLKTLYAALVSAKDDKGEPLATPLMTMPSKRRNETPIDLNTIDSRIKSGHYRSLHEFDTDMNRLLANAVRHYGRSSQMVGVTEQLKAVYTAAKRDHLPQIEAELGEPPPSASPLHNQAGGCDDNEDKEVEEEVEEKEEEMEEKGKDKEEEEVIRCVCGILRDEGLMIQCEKCMVWQHCDCVKADPGVESYLCEKCHARPVDREIKYDTNPPYAQPGQTHYMTLMRGQLQIRQGDTVYVLRDIPNEETGTKHNYKTIKVIDYNDCDIFRIERLWKDEKGDRFVFGHHYLRPHETYHEPTRKFYLNEVMRVPLYEVVSIDLVMAHCYVLDPNTFCKGRPRDAVMEHVYICEYRVDKGARLFAKLARAKQPPVCTKAYAFHTYPQRLKISRTYTPHGPPPSTSSVSGGKTSSAHDSEQQGSSVALSSNATATKSNATAAKSNATAAKSNVTAAKSNATVAKSNATAAKGNATAAKSNATVAKSNAALTACNVTNNSSQTDVSRLPMAARRGDQKHRVNSIALRLLARLPSKQPPLDLSYLLEPSRRNRKRPALLSP